MRTFLRYAVGICALGLLPAFLSPLCAAEARPVAEEFQEKVDAVVEALKTQSPPDAVDFPPCQARFVRIIIRHTKGNSQPGIDELEIFGPDGKKNLALAETGAVASASSVIPGYPIHQIAHLNDGTIRKRP